MTKTMEERLDTIRLGVVRIEACLAFMRTDAALRSSSNEELITAAIQEAGAIDLELCWFRNVPIAILQTPAPTDDETSKAGAR